MIIFNKITCTDKGKGVTVVFNEGVNIISSIKNQYGKSTIMLSILYALGAKETIFSNNDIMPDYVELDITVNSNTYSIIRDALGWTIEGKNIADANELSSMIFPFMPKVKNNWGMSIISSDWIFSMAFINQSTSPVAFRKNIGTSGEKQIERIFLGANVDGLSEKIEEESLLEASNKRSRMAVKIKEIFIDNKDDLEDLSAITNIREELDKMSRKLQSIEKTMRDNYEIISSMEKTNKFISKARNKFMLMKNKELNITAWDIIEKYINIDNEFSPREYEMAILEYEKNSLYRDEIIHKIEEKNSEINSLPSATRKAFIGETLKTVLKIDDEVDISVLKGEIREIKDAQDKVVEQTKADIISEMKTMGVVNSGAGLGERVRKLLTSNKVQEVMDIPILFDDFRLGSNKESLAEKVYPYIDKKIKGQIIITSDHEDINSDMQEYLVATLKNPIFE